MKQIVAVVLILTSGLLVRLRGSLKSHGRGSADCAGARPPDTGDRGAARPVARRDRRTLRVAKQEIIQLNHLAPPYTLKAGATLLVPAVHAQPVKQAKPRPAAPPPTDESS